MRKKINRWDKTKTLDQTVTKQKYTLTTMISWQAQIPKRQTNYLAIYIES